MEIKLTKETTLELCILLQSFYDGITDVTDYYLKKKSDKLSQKDFVDVSNNLFCESNVNPNDLSISIEKIDSDDFTNHVQQIATFPIESQIGRRITFGVRENNTKKYLGFLRISSPVSSIKPRNDFFGTSLRLDKVNKHFYNGQVIVPVQPFGYNYLGGKLISLICCSNEIRNIFNEKYNTDICVFETTSLYGSSKSTSMYDGLEPYIRFKGLTESKNVLSPTDEIYFYIRDEIRKHFGKKEWNNSLVDPKPSSPKSRELNKIIQILKHHLNHYDSKSYTEFVNILKTKSITYQQKRYYMSTMGYTNVVDHIVNNSILKSENQNKFDLENIISYWKKKSEKRWNTLKEKNKLLTDLEFYTTENISSGPNFKIIR